MPYRRRIRHRFIHKRSQFVRHRFARQRSSMFAITIIASLARDPSLFAITMPVSQVTCERSFSKMKIIKTHLRNTMTDRRLSDLTIMAIEREIDVDYERVIDTFSINHKNSRILLR